MEKILMKWLATGEFRELWQSEDHPDAMPGSPVWSDDQGTNWGKVALWPVPYGFIRTDDPEYDLYSPVLSEYWRLKMFFSLHYINSEEMNKTPVIQRFRRLDEKEFSGMPDYAIRRFKTLQGEDRLVVVFDERIILPTGERSDRFIIWTGPAIKMDPAGKEAEWIPYF